MKCSICGLPIDVGPGNWDQGHNAQPINDGRCCTSCNNHIVIPRRIVDVSSPPNDWDGTPTESWLRRNPG